MVRRLPGARLLAIARHWFDTTTVSSVFEPLVADWQREWAGAQHAGVIARFRIACSGSWALFIALMACAATLLTTPPPASSATRALAAFGAAVVLSPFLVLGVVVSAMRPGPTAGWVDMWLPPAMLSAAASAIPVAMLPFLLTLRRDSKVTCWHAVQGVMVGLVLYACCALGSVLIYAMPPTAAQQERLALRTEANDRAGRYEYPGSAFRQLHPTTPEERAKLQHERALKIATISAQLRQRAISSFFSIRTAPALLLIIVLGATGWLLGALGPATFGRMAGWWTLTWLATYTLRAPLAGLLRGNPLRDYVEWAPTLLFLGVVLALSIGKGRADQQIDHPID